MMKHPVAAALAAALFLVAGSSFAAKPVVGVAEFDNTATGVGWWGGGVGWDLSDMLTNELVSGGHFSVIERSRLEHVLREQQLTSSGAVAPGTGAKVGELTGAQYLVLGTVSAFESNTSSTGGGISFGGVSIGGQRNEAYLAIDLRVVNTTTGAIEYVRTVEGRSGGGGLSLGVFRSGFGGRLANESRTPAGKAIRAAMIEAVEYLECAMVIQGTCMAEFDAKERSRRDSARGTLKLD
jgi:curli biogenesis system outer membrane secretion channel CsgG